MYYMPNVFTAEHEAAAYLAKLLQCKVQKIEAVTTGLAHKQPQAVVNACTNAVSILTGPPGTGKTTTTKCIIDSFEKAGLKRGIITCPTGKAAKRADEVVNCDMSSGLKRGTPIEALTMHRLLKPIYGDGEQFTYNEQNQLPYDYIVVDEFSMVGIMMLARFLSSVKPGTRLILCGDQHQLPSVEAGNIARDLMLSGFIPTVELDHIFRQGANSGIVYNASRILHGESICSIDPRTGEAFTDFFFVQRNTEEETVSTLVKYICEDIPVKRELNAFTDIQALSPGKKSKVGVKAINDVLREKLTTGRTGKSGYRIGDKVINKANNYELDIVNGDCGIVTDETADGIKVDFGGGVGIIEINGPALGKIMLNYCGTIHSSQGSEYPSVLMPLHRCHYMLLFRNLLYTGMTRGKELTVLIGDPKALALCIKNNAPEQRKTGFLSALRRYCNE